MRQERARRRVVRVGVIYVRYLPPRWAAQEARQAHWQPHGEIVEFSNHSFAYVLYHDGVGSVGSSGAHFDQSEAEWDSNPTGPHYHVHWTELELPDCSEVAAATASEVRTGATDAAGMHRFRPDRDDRCKEQGCGSDEMDSHHIQTHDAGKHWVDDGSGFSAVACSGREPESMRIG